MPLERRDILFYLVEIQDILDSKTDKFGAYLPKSFSSMSLSDACLTSNIKKISNERRAAFEPVIKASEGAFSSSGVIFVCKKKGFMGGEKTDGFIIPEEKMLSGIISECSKRGIALPKQAKKEIIVDDLMIGLRIIKSDDSLTLEE